MNKLETELLQVALGIRPELSQIYNNEEWDACYEFAGKQAIVGVLFAGIERLPKQQRPYNDLLMLWIRQVMYMLTQSEKLDQMCALVARNFKLAGFDCVILKGQGVAKLYKQFLGSAGNFNSSLSVSSSSKDHFLLRTPGDIDCWVFADRSDIWNYLKKNVPSFTGEHDGNLHTEFIFHNTTVEVHYTATYLITPIYNKRLQDWLKKQALGFVINIEKDAITNAPLDTTASLSTEENVKYKITNYFPTPTLEFNLVYLILHMYRHYLFEGIGLRHVVDYYIVLQMTTDEQKREAMKILNSFGAGDFARALMWVLNECLEMKAESMLCKPNAWRGKMLMDAILKGGNFGKFDKINSIEFRQWGMKRCWRFVLRNMRLFIAYPNEIGWHVVKRLCCIQ